MRRMIITLIVLSAVLGALCFTAFQKLPYLLVTQIEKGLEKRVTLEDARYVFPWGLRIQGLTVFGEAPFQNEPVLLVRQTRVQFDPACIWSGAVKLKFVDITNPQIIIRKLNRKYLYVLSAPGDSLQEPIDANRSVKLGPDKVIDPVTITIDRVSIQKGFLRFIDYDIAEQGFALDLSNIDVTLGHLSGSHSNIAMTYDFSAELLQGRDQVPAKIEGRGFTHPRTIDTDTNIKLENFWMPYFVPYYRKVTPARIDSGYLNLQSTTVVKDRDWTSNARADIRQLKFGTDEGGGELFGFDAETLVGLLQDRNGNLNLDLVLRWDLNDPSMNFKRALRKSIQYSIKNSLLLNIQNVIDNTLNKISEEGTDFFKKDWKSTLDTIRDIID